METKELIYGLIGFFIGGLLVAIAANTFNNAELQKNQVSEKMSYVITEKYIN